MAVLNYEGLSYLYSQLVARFANQNEVKLLSDDVGQLEANLEKTFNTVKVGETSITGSSTTSLTLKGDNIILTPNADNKTIAFNISDDIIPISAEQTGDFITVENGIDGYGFKATSIIEPIQSGSGDPSPDNIRPISGRETVNLNHTDAHYAGWKDIIADINNGLGAAKYPVGTKFVIPHSVYGERLFEVVAHDYLKAVGDEGKHTMTIQQQDLLPNTQFDAAEAFYYAEAELPAGTYNFTLATAYNSWAAGTYQFTLTKAVPKGGQLAISGNFNTTITSLTVRSYANQTTTTVTESVAITTGSGGMNLGTFGEGLNHLHRVSYGSDNYKESAMRQFLNSSAAAGSVWTPQTKFDRPPSWLTSLAGYKNGLGQDFLAVVGKVVLPCSANNTYEAPDSSIKKGTKYTLNDEFYLASRAEIFGKHDMDDGTVLFPFYEDAGNADRIKYRDGSAGNWWLRTPIPGVAFTMRLVKSDGTAYSHAAYSSYGPAPACTIYDTGIIPNGAVRIIAKDEEFTAENKQIYTTQFGQTVYGGTFDWNTGVLTIDRKQGTITSLEGQFDSQGILAVAQQVSNIEPVNNSHIAANIISDYLPVYSLEDARKETVANAIVHYGNYLYIKVKGCSTAADYQNWIANNPITYVYKLAEPYAIQLTPQHLTMLRGRNNFYSSSTTLKIKTNTSIITNEVIGKLKVLSQDSADEGGEIQLQAPKAQKNINGIVLDNKNGVFRIFGNPSADGTTKTGNGGIFSVDPYAKTITADSYTFSGTAQKAATFFVSVGEEPSSEQYFYPIFVTNKNQNYYAPKVSSGFQFYTKTGTTSTTGLAQICAGNNIKSGTAGNMAGILCLYGTGSGYTYLKPSNNTDSNYEVQLPAESGTLALAYSAGAGLSLSNNTFSVKSSILGTYSRDEIGTSPNFDDPGVNGMFEIRASRETPGETGTRPFNAFGPFLNLKTPDNRAMLQIAGYYNGIYIRAKQTVNVTMADSPWNEILTSAHYGSSVSALGAASAGAAITVSRSDHVHALPALTSCAGTLTIEKGGTGKTTAAEARVALGITSSATQTVYHTGNIVASTTAPTAPTEGMIWIVVD